MNIKPGKYKHWKGQIVTVMGVGKSSEDYTTESVIYSHPYEGHDQIWIRPLEMFFEEVDRDGYKGPRFTKISD